MGHPTAPFATELRSHAQATSIDDLAHIDPRAFVAHDCVIKSGAHICAGVTLERGVYVGAKNHVAAPLIAPVAPARRPAVQATPVHGVTLHHFPLIPDLRGSLTVGEFDRQVPFKPLRYFMVFGVPNREIRGEHAHHRCEQFLICVRGSCSVVADDGQNKIEVLLDGPDQGLYLPPLTWGVQYKYSADAMLLVFASHYYDAADYIREYDEFQSVVSALAA